MNLAQHIPGTALAGSFRSAMHDFYTRCYFKFVLPQITSATIEGIHLDLSRLSLKIRNRILKGYEEAEKMLCHRLLCRNDRVLELGGGIGFIGLYCQKRLGITNYVTVEANPFTISLLKENYQLNGMTPNVLNYAISDRNGPALLNIGGDFWEHSVGTKPENENCLEVPGITFTDLLNSLPFHPNTLIIDVEGAERFINFREIPEDIRKIIIEIHPVIVGEASTEDLIRAVCDNGFRIVCKEGYTMALTKEF